jgi:glycosyltransferase involved in cell wall biosynthesis
MSPPIIVTGAPFSGGSFVLQALVRAGLAVGAPVANPAGQQDAFVALHDRIFSSDRFAIPPGPMAASISVPADLQADATALVAARRERGQAWGWHDARTTLCLDFWDRAVADARLIFTVREPAVQVWSLVARGRMNGCGRTPVGRARAALRLWQRFNHLLLQFAITHPGRCLVMVMPDDVDATGEAVLNRVVREHWGGALGAVGLRDDFVAHLFRRRAPRWIRLMTAADRGALALFRSLQAVGAEPPASRTRAAVARQNGPVVCVATGRAAGYSETFIRAHVERLPARVTPLYLGGATWVTGDGLPIMTLFERVVGAVTRELRIERVPLRVRALCRYLKRQRVQAVLAQFGGNGARVYRACERTGVPLIVHFHGYDAYKRPGLEEHLEDYARMFAAAAAIVAVSREMEEQLVALGAPRSKLVYCPYGVDAARFSQADPAAAPPTFLAVGRFVEKKAPHLTLLAFHQVLQTFPEARLIMAGDGMLRDPCKQLAAALRFDGSVSFLGAIPHSQVARLMRQVRAFVQHSIRAGDGDSEGTPVAVLEAGAAGLPVVATAHAGIRDVVVHAETGFLVPEGDVDGMARFMSMLVADAGLAATMGRKARAHVSTHLSMDASIARLWSVIEGAIAGATAAPRRGAVALDRCGEFEEVR